MRLQVGDKIPNFSAIDATGRLFESQSIVGKKAVIIYFYPKDNTPQCTAQACGFRDYYSDFKDLEIDIIGISADDKASHQDFAQKYNLPFILLSDADNVIRKLFGVPNQLFGLLPGRVTYLVDKNGIVQLIFDSMIGMKHVKRMIDKVNHESN